MVSSPSTYPLKGIYFFFSNWILVRRVIVILLVTLLVSLVTLGLVFGFLLKPQAHALILAGCPAWIAWIVSIVFCFLETVIFTIIVYLIITPIWQDALFDDVLRLKGLSNVLERKGKPSDLVLCCRGLCSGFFLLMFQIYVLILFQIITLLITLPLHLFPVMGTLLYCYLNGWIMTWGHQIHYHLEIKHWSVNQSRKFAWKNREDYIEYGAVAVALELLPILNLVFFWTNVVGAALWTADVIREEQKALSRTGVDGFNGPHTLNNPASTSSSYQAAQSMDDNGYGAIIV